MTEKEEQKLLKIADDIYQDSYSQYDGTVLESHYKFHAFQEACRRLKVQIVDDEKDEAIKDLTS